MGGHDKAYHRSRARRFAAERHASAYAAVHKRMKAAKTGSAADYVKLSREALDFHHRALGAQRDFLDSLKGMTDLELLDTLFDLFDANQDEEVDARELAMGLKKVDHGMNLVQGLEKAVKNVSEFDQDGNAKLNRAEFRTFGHSFADEIKLTLEELAQLLVLEILFQEKNEDGDDTFLTDSFMNLAADDVGIDRDELEGALTDKRMMALFKLFDKNSDGAVDFKEIAMGLYQLTEDMAQSSKDAAGALLMFDKNKKRTLNYIGFCKVILNVVATWEAKFEDVADAMTMEVIADKEITESDMAVLVVSDATLLEAKEHEKTGDKIDPVEYGRMQRLFNIWDLDHNGYVEFNELVLGLRKYHGAKKTNMDATVAESVQALMIHDENDDQKLDMTEFASFLANFAKKAEQELQEVVDFMVVISALKDNSESEKAYVESIGMSVASQIRRRESLK